MTGDGQCGPGGRHTAPDPVDAPTQCPCGTLTRMPPPKPKDDQ